MSDAALAAWRTWVTSDAAVKHIQVVITKRFRNRRHPLPPSDMDDLVGDIQQRLLEKAADYDPARGAPSTLGSTMIPCLLIDVLDWLRVHFPDRYRAVHLARLASRQDDGVNDGFDFDPPDAEGIADRYGQAKAVVSERDAAIHAALERLDGPTQRFAKRLMDGQKPLVAGAYLDWGEDEIADAIARMQVALSRAGITA
jgi:hypothetical protein